jgi:hypothetical protein
MTENDQIKVWRKEYTALTGEGPGYSAKWAGFLLAKRSMPAIELPANYYRADVYDMHGAAAEAFDSAIDDVSLAITAAGYKYKIK